VLRPLLIFLFAAACTSGPECQDAICPVCADAARKGEAEGGQDAEDAPAAADEGAIDSAGFQDLDVALAPDYSPGPTDPAIPCDDPQWLVYLTPDALPPFGPATRGDLTRCHKDAVFPKAYMVSQLEAVGEPTDELPESAQTYLVAYRTERLDGIGGLGTARVYLPSNPLRTDQFVVVTHGTTGLADQCAPSLVPEINNYMVIPLLARGWAVIAPDYAGLGTDGTQGYHNAADTGHSVLDAARAMANLFPFLSEARFAVLGHSQGGGAAMAAQALSEQYGPAGKLTGVVAFAPGYSFRDSSWVPLFPDYAIPGLTGFVFAMIFYADFANLLGVEHAGYAFDPAIRQEVVEAVGGLCAYAFVGVDSFYAATLGELFDDEFEKAVKACLVQSVCTDEVSLWIERCKKNVIPLDPAGAPLLIVGGDVDPLLPPSEMACLNDWLDSFLMPYQLCMGSGQDHFTAVYGNMGLAVEWLDDLFSGLPPASCPAATLPPCPW
jgi:pimeloyl-ACP methyl ester carboxylesterase